MRVFKVVIEAHDSVEKRDVSDIVHEVLMDLHPNIAKSIRFVGLEAYEDKEKFEPNDDIDDCICDDCTASRLRVFAEKLASEQVDLDPEIQAVIDENFWDLK